MYNSDGTRKKGRSKNEYTEQIIKNVYREKVTAPIVEPHCNCEGCYSWLGGVIPKLAKYGQANIQVTKLGKDRETCEFCGHYVLWQEAGCQRNNFRNKKRGKYNKKIK